MQQGKILIIGKVWPEPNSSAAGVRMMQLIDIFLENEFEVNFACTAQSTGNEILLEPLGVKTYSIKVNDSEFDRFLLNLHPDMVMYDRFMTEEQFGWRVREQLPASLTLLDSEDLHFLRKGRQEGIKKRGGILEEDLYNDTTKREIASILRTDLTLVISKYEMTLLEEKFQISRSKLFYLPIQASKAEEIIPFEERKDVVFIGNFMHDPNWDAVLQLKNIWKQWTNKPKHIHLRIYGAYPPQKAYGLNSERDQFHIMGRATSAKEVISNARLLIAPIRFGAGLKGKLIEAMQYGTPTITTTIGAEGLGDKEHWGGVVEDNLEMWPTIVASLFDDKTGWESAQGIGFENLNRLNKDFKIDDFVQRIRSLMKGIHRHRQDNFLGEVLHHHTIRSTEYLSRWIEEKNKV